MINKQNLWFVTLFSLILILGIYYVTMIDKDATLAAISESVSNNIKETASVEVLDSSTLVSLRVKEDEEVMAKMEELQTILLDEKATLEEKNNAYESLQSINTNKGKEEEIENLIKKEFNLNSFVKISGDKISITIASDDHDVKKANDIIIKVQDLYQERMFITIRFQK
jgi:hypothetical protein